jgi:hypothetical protein
VKRAKEDLTTRYLLGALPDAERDEFEKKYLADDAAYEELLLAEDQLIDAFVRDELSAEERELFERQFIVSPIRRERVEFARALMSPEIDPLLMPSEAQPQSFGHRSYGKPAFSTWAQRLAWVGAALIGFLIVVSSWFFFENRRLNRDLVRVQSEKPVIENKKQASGSQQDRPSVPVTGPLSLVLTPGLSRDSAQLPGVKLSQGIDTLSLQLELEGVATNSTYRATVETPEGKEVWSRSGLPRRERAGGSGSILIEIPAAVLVPGDYVVTLRAGRTPEEIADYHFRVLR